MKFSYIKKLKSWLLWELTALIIGIVVYILIK